MIIKNTKKGYPNENYFFVKLYCSLLMAGCASTNLGSNYIKLNQQKVEKYVEVHGDKISTLNGLISDECYVKIIKKKRDMSLDSLIRLTYQGTVYYHLNEDGVILNVIFDTKNSTTAKRMCLKNIAIGYQLTNTNGLEYISSHFNVTYTP